VELVQVVEQGAVLGVVPLQVVAELLEVQARHGAVIELGQLPQCGRTDRTVEMAVQVGQGQGLDEAAAILGGHGGTSRLGGPGCRTG